MPMNGLGQGLIPIVGYNYGAKKYGRIREAFRFSLPVGCIIALIMTMVFMIFPKELLSLFNADEEMLSIGINALRIMSLSFVSASVTIILGYGLSGIGNGVINMVSAFIRQLIIPLVLIYITGKLFGLSYVWYSFLVSEIVAMVYALVSSLSYSKKKESGLFKKRISGSSFLLVWLVFWFYGSVWHVLVHRQLLDVCRCLQISY